MFCWYSWFGENMHSPVYLYVRSPRMSMPIWDFPETDCPNGHERNESTANAGFAPFARCVVHFTLSLESGCAEMRRETALGTTGHERQREIMRFITENGEKLARVATSGLHLTDDLKARILSTFLTLMNLRENLDRASMRSSYGRHTVPR